LMLISLFELSEYCIPALIELYFQKEEEKFKTIGAFFIFYFQA